MLRSQLARHIGGGALGRQTWRAAVAAAVPVTATATTAATATRAATALRFARPFSGGAVAAFSVSLGRRGPRRRRSKTERVWAPSERKKRQASSHPRHVLFSANEQQYDYYVPLNVVMTSPDPWSRAYATFVEPDETSDRLEVLYLEWQVLDAMRLRVVDQRHVTVLPERPLSRHCIENSLGIFDEQSAGLRMRPLPSGSPAAASAAEPSPALRRAADEFLSGALTLGEAVAVFEAYCNEVFGGSGKSFCVVMPSLEAYMHGLAMDAHSKGMLLPSCLDSVIPMFLNSLDGEQAASLLLPESLRDFVPMTFGLYARQRDRDVVRALMAREDGGVAGADAAALPQLSPALSEALAGHRVVRASDEELYDPLDVGTGAADAALCRIRVNEPLSPVLTHLSFAVAENLQRGGHTQLVAPRNLRACMAQFIRDDGRSIMLHGARSWPLQRRQALELWINATLWTSSVRDGDAEYQQQPQGQQGQQDQEQDQQGQQDQEQPQLPDSGIVGIWRHEDFPSVVVEFEDTDTALNAMLVLNGKSVFGRPMTAWPVVAAEQPWIQAEFVPFFLTAAGSFDTSEGWICPAKLCAYHNRFEHTRECYACGTLRYWSDRAHAIRNSGGLARIMEHAHWACFDCGFVNSPDRALCFWCGTGVSAQRCMSATALAVPLHAELMVQRDRRQAAAAEAKVAARRVSGDEEGEGGEGEGEKANQAGGVVGEGAVSWPYAIGAGYKDIQGLQGDPTAWWTCSTCGVACPHTRTMCINCSTPKARRFSWVAAQEDHEEGKVLLDEATVLRNEQEWWIRV